MEEKKKIFNESDFDKDKPLFTSEDFEKEKEVRKEPKIGTAPTPTPNGDGGNEKGGIVKVFGGIAAVAFAGLLCYGAYSYFTSPSEKNDVTTTEQVEGTASTLDEKGTKDASNTETANNDESASDEGVKTPEQDVTSNGASSPQSESTQDGTTKTTEPSKATTPASQSITPSSLLEEKAKEVIRGNYGNGEVRKQKLGVQYAEIQGKVNEMYRNGLVK